MTAPMLTPARFLPVAAGRERALANDLVPAHGRATGSDQGSLLKQQLRLEARVFPSMPGQACAAGPCVAFSTTNFWELLDAR
jgi:hypothetical protein